MNFYKVHLVIFWFYVFSFIAVQATTHMPDIQPPTLAPEIAKALEHKYTSKECTEDIRYGGDDVVKSLFHGSIKATPCDDCSLTKMKLEGFTADNVVVANLSMYETVIQATISIAKYNILCRKCTLTDDSGKKVTGYLDLTAFHPKFKMTVTHLDGGGHDEKVTINLIVRLDDKKNNQVLWDEDAPDFSSACKKAHATGELDHVLEYAIESLFIEDRVPNERMRRYIQQDLTAIFNCEFRFLKDLVPVKD